MRDRAETGGSERMTGNVKTDVVKLVAEAACPECYGGGYQDEEMGGEVGYIKWDCQPCDATGLRWPTLSRECDCRRKETHFCKDFVVPGRIPDVTLEKVFEIFQTNHISFRMVYLNQMAGSDGVETVLVVNHDETDLPPLEAACSALLATVED